ncbi:MAG TPA: hypothetical protein VNI55_01765 [Gaiellaceae bacterium]|nr:hypothetical protein [Gaiellaceae bacterium]
MLPELTAVREAFERWLYLADASAFYEEQQSSSDHFLRETTT